MPKSQNRIRSDFKSLAISPIPLSLSFGISLFFFLLRSSLLFGQGIGNPQILGKKAKNDPKKENRKKQKSKEIQKRREGGSGISPAIWNRRAPAKSQPKSPLKLLKTRVGSATEITMIP